MLRNLLFRCHASVVLVSAPISLTHITYTMLTVLSGGIPFWPWRSYFRRLRNHFQNRPTRQDSRQSTESLLADRRFSYEDTESAQRGNPLVTLGQPASSMPDLVRRRLWWAVGFGLGCHHALTRPCSHGKIEWNADAYNTANAQLACNNIL